MMLIIDTTTIDRNKHSSIYGKKKKKKRKYIKATKLTLKGLQINMAFECIWQHIKDIKDSFIFYFFFEREFQVSTYGIRS